MLFPDVVKLEKLLKPVKVYHRDRFNGVDVFSIDSRTVNRGEGFIAIKGKYKDGHDFIPEAITKGVSLVIAQEDIFFKPEVTLFIVKDTLASLEVLAKYIRKKKNPFIFAVTGSVGKTITKEMLSFLLGEKNRVLKSNKTENNLLGVGKTLFSLRHEETVVLELGTNSPGEIEKLAGIVYPDVGIITFIKPVHLEGLKSLKGILAEKTSLFKSNPRIKAVLNRNDGYLRNWGRDREVYWFSRHKYKGKGLYASFVSRDQEKSVFLVQDRFKLVLPTPFPGFITNALAAVSAASILGLETAELVDKMNRFTGFPCLRMEVKDLGNFLFINDAYNANPYSVIEGLKVTDSFPLEKIAVIGDMLELGNRAIYYHQLLAPRIIASGFNYCLAMGSHTIYLIEKLRELGYRNSYHFSSHQDVARFIKKTVKKRNLIFLKGSRKMELEKIMDFI